MNEASSIRFISRDQLDTEQWDNCIGSAPNGLIYGYSVYLDTMAEHWDALVLGDYKAVMPLTWKRKYNISYLYQPFLTAQLGLFGAGLTADLLHAFLKAVPQRFAYWDIYLNQGNLFLLQDFDLYRRVNYVLPLDKTHDELFQEYRETTRRNIKRCEKLETVIDREVNAKEVIELSLASMKSTGKETRDNVNRFEQLYTNLSAKGCAKAYGIRTAGGKLLSSAVFFLSHNRAYYILVGNHPDGRTMGASHLVIDVFIRDHANTNLLLDFEGSDLRNLAFFYSSFGAREEHYPGCRVNRLPFYMKWLKR